MTIASRLKLNVICRNAPQQIVVVALFKEYLICYPFPFSYSVFSFLFFFATFHLLLPFTSPISLLYSVTVYILEHAYNMLLEAVMESDSWAPIFAQHSADPKGISLPPSFLLFSSLYSSPSFNFLLLLAKINMNLPSVIMIDNLQSVGIFNLFYNFLIFFFVFILFLLLLLLLLLFLFLFLFYIFIFIFIFYFYFYIISFTYYIHYKYNIYLFIYLLFLSLVM